jgi:hypothetical protein
MFEYVAYMNVKIKSAYQRVPLTTPKLSEQWIPAHPLHLWEQKPPGQAAIDHWDALEGDCLGKHGVGGGAGQMNMYVYGAFEGGHHKRHDLEHGLFDLPQPDGWRCIQEDMHEEAWRGGD